MDLTYTSARRHRGRVGRVLAPLLAGLVLAGCIRTADVPCGDEFGHVCPKDTLCRLVTNSDNPQEPEALLCVGSGAIEACEGKGLEDDAVSARAETGGTGDVRDVDAELW